MFALIIIRIEEEAKVQRGAVHNPGPHSQTEEELAYALCSTPQSAVQKGLKWKLCPSQKVPGLGCPLCSDEARTTVQHRMTPGHLWLCTQPAHKGHLERGTTAAFP